MKASTILGACCLGLLIFIVLVSKTGGLTFEGNQNKPIEVGGSMAKPPEPPKQPVYSNTDTNSNPQTCPKVSVGIPAGITTVIIGEDSALIVDTEGKNSFTLTDCVDLDKAHIELCDDENKCTEGKFANGAMQTKSTS
jgi:hypothetical protein